MLFLSKRRTSDVKNAADWMQEWDGISVLSHNTTLSGGVGILYSLRVLVQSLIKLMRL